MKQLSIIKFWSTEKEEWIDHEIHGYSNYDGYCINKTHEDLLESKKSNEQFKIEVSDIQLGIPYKEKSIDSK